jgi:hypothetical protein
VSSTDVLLILATAARLFHASDGTGFADLIIDGHRETWPLRSKRFQAWLRQHYYERIWDAPSPAALNAAVLEAQPTTVDNVGLREVIRFCRVVWWRLCPVRVKARQKSQRFRGGRCSD